GFQRAKLPPACRPASRLGWAGRTRHDLPTRQTKGLALTRAGTIIAATTVRRISMQVLSVLTSSVSCILTPVWCAWSFEPELSPYCLRGHRGYAHSRRISHAGRRQGLPRSCSDWISKRPIREPFRHCSHTKL